MQLLIMQILRTERSVRFRELRETPRVRRRFRVPLKNPNRCLLNLTNLNEKFLIERVPIRCYQTPSKHSQPDRQIMLDEKFLI